MLARAPRHETMRRLFQAMSALLLVYTPIRSLFAIRDSFPCEGQTSLERWLAGIPNPWHLGSYGVLMLVGSFAFRERPLLKAGVLVFLLSVAVELEQAVFTVGHCRLRDLLPNLLAVLLGGGIYWALRWARG